MNRLPPAAFRPGSSLLLLLLAVAPLGSGCRKPMPSPDYIEASNRYTSLLAVHGGDDAYATPEMDGVSAQLGKVPAKSSDYAAAQALIAAIASERARVAAAVAQAVVVVPLPPPNFPPTPVAAAQPEPAVVVAAADAGRDDFVRGGDLTQLQAKYPGCMLPIGPVNLVGPDGRGAENLGFELHDSAHCRTRIPAMVAGVALFREGKLSHVLPKSSLKVTTVLEDGGATAPR